MPDTWIHGISTMPVETKLARNIRLQIGVLEELDTLLNAWGVRTEQVKETLSTAYENSLLFGEHTWVGTSMRLVIITVTMEKGIAAGRYRDMLSSFDEHRAYIRKVAELVGPALDKRTESACRFRQGER